MATLDTTSQLTLVEQAKRIDPEGELSAIAEVLSEDNEILLDAVWQEANDTWAHKCTRRANLPSGSFRKLNSGVATEASQTVEVYETIAMLETYAENDKDLIDSFPNSKKARMDEAKAFLEGLSQTMAQKLIYGNMASNPEEINGLQKRMNALASTANVLDGSGSGSDLSSIYVVQWGVDKVFLGYPKGSKLGLNHQDLGEVTLQDGSGNNYQGYRDHFQSKFGLVVKDDRCIGRVANYETSGTSNLFDEDDLITLLNRMPKSGAGSVIYVNATIKSQMEIALKDKTNVNFTVENGLGGVPVLKFRGLPVRRVDQILNTESAVT